jgi:hypothetical protein
MITHGSLGASIVRFQSSSKRNLAKNWSVKLGADCSHDDTISELMLNYAAPANENGLVLFSSKSALPVNKNMNAVLEPDIPPAQVALFGQLVMRDLILSIQLE